MAKENPFNASDEQQVDASKRRESRTIRRDLLDLKLIMSSVEGRRVIWRTLERSGLYKTSFTGNSNSTCFNEGSRNIGLWLLSDLMEACPDLYLTALTESKQEDPNVQ